MKYILVLLVILFAVWLWQHNRRNEQRDEAASRRPPVSPPPPPVARTPQPMVACAHCGLHLPADEAVTSAPAGLHYCSESHRRLGEPG
jgi:uncharacterized protein